MAARRAGRIRFAHKDFIGGLGKRSLDAGGRGAKRQLTEMASVWTLLAIDREEKIRVLNGEIYLENRADV